jgi:tRNA-Thr(GGU) m(6)t(6)A37 methyltransferase TsaA
LNKLLCSLEAITIIARGQTLILKLQTKAAVLLIRAKKRRKSRGSPMIQISFKPIGEIRIQTSEAEIRDESGEVEGELEIYPEFENALEGIDGYSHLFVLTYFHKLRLEQIGPLQVKPRRLVKRGFTLEELPLLGVFALDSPTRPNPIGLTLVEFLGRQGRHLKVKGIDYFDGTPILDIKGYRPEYRAEKFELPAWYKKLQDVRGHI